MGDDAFNLMGKFAQAARRQGVAKADVDAVIKDCTSDDYNHLLQVLVVNTIEDYDE